MNINFITAVTHIIDYLENSGHDVGEWDTYGAAKDLCAICEMNYYTDYNQVSNAEFTELLKEHKL